MRSAVGNWDSTASMASHHSIIFVNTPIFLQCRLISNRCGAILEKTSRRIQDVGSLNRIRGPSLVICHAFTGSADVEDWESSQSIGCAF